VFRPVRVSNERPKKRVSFWDDAKGVVHLSLEATRGKRKITQRGYARIVRVKSDREFETMIWRTARKDIDHAKTLVVVVCRYQR
jgi:ribulose bisphosphate carboxylase small subunit